MQGHIKNIVLDRGFGFIRRDDGDDVFFHVNDLNGLPFDERLAELCVAFDVVPGRDGRERARNVRPAC